MTEQISGILVRIQGNFEDLHRQLLAEREKNASLDTELKQARVLLSANQEEISGLNAQIQGLQSDLDQLKEQIESHTSAAITDKDAEIDALVREIDNCISQLKQ